MKLKVVYNAPNRAPHYAYARQLHDAGILQAFVSGFPRFSPRAPFPELNGKLIRADQLQTLYVASLRQHIFPGISEELAHLAKIQLDRRAGRVLQEANVFIFYNGCGLGSARLFKKNGGISIVEAVNSHVQVQEKLLHEEHRSLGLPWRPFHRRETARRIAEVEEADYVLVPSSFVERSFLSKGIRPDRILKVRFPMRKIAGAKSSADESSQDDGVFRVLYVGSVSVRKGLRYLVEAFRQLNHPKKELWIVGPIASPTGLDGVPLPEGVRFFGPLKGDELQNAYKKATVFCLPSIEEGLALVLLEALSYDLPIIATENSGFEDMLHEGRGGIVAPIRDAEAIGRELNRLAGDKEYFARKRAEAMENRKRIATDESLGGTLASKLISTFEKS